MSALKDKSMRDLTEARVGLWDIFEDVNAPDHVRQGAAALLNYYGAEIDMRLAKRDA